ncbi:TPA: hypothetical protein DCW38_03920 [candidate division WOR-3 bacterium]|jgi:Na+/H+ antiporter NhaD/arsenite permease-like protein|uniref:Citrate transporter-like domain-containing protein n=1 Tax=candidate division WOR-3 bacterium TaxID=2052148 RepID=A0A350H9U3_UNCW3|nr:hypothetical protein [candidate division WOR-3 bacterium]
MGYQSIIGVILFVIIFILISTEKFNKTILSLLGGALFMVLHFVSQELAFLSIDWNVIFLLISMMVIVGITKKTGLFQYVAIKAAKISRGKPVNIMILLSLITALFSAFLDNVTTVMIITPVAILIAVELGISPIPFVISCAIASNLGGTATLIGDPPNIMIGSAANLDFNSFLFNLTPIIIIIMIVYSLLIYLFFRKKMRISNERKARIMDFDESKSIENKPLLIKSLTVLSLVIAGFLIHGFLNLEPATIALFGAGLLMLLTGEKEVDEFFHDVEWGTIFFFIGLFILVGGLVELGIIKKVASFVLNLTNGNMKSTSLLVLWISGVFSAFIDNIPYVATMIPLIKDIGVHVGPDKIQPLWWSLALGACLGGNGTLIGASANVVSAGLAKKNGYKISFWEFTKYGSIITIITLAISTIYIYFRYLIRI